MTAKTRAIPSLHRDYLPAKETGQLPGAASGNTAYLYCSAIMLNSLVICHIKKFKHRIFHNPNNQH